jgi:hypothetical protein
VAAIVDVAGELVGGVEAGDPVGEGAVVLPVGAGSSSEHANAVTPSAAIARLPNERRWMNNRRSSGWGNVTSSRRT